MAFVVVGVIDFDAETGDDPQQHGEYAFQTFQYYKVGTHNINKFIDKNCQLKLVSN